MSDYMAQKADEQIEGGLREQERLYEELTALKVENEKLRINLNVCKNDYWFMSNLLEHYSTDKDQAIKDCIERMKFRKPIFNILDEEEETALCRACNGSGEGYYTTNDKCLACDGNGIEK